MTPQQATHLRQKRTQSRYTQKEAAQKLNVAVSTYREWEKPHGAEPASITKMIEIAELFNLSLDKWLTGKEKQALKREERKLLALTQQLDKKVAAALAELIKQIIAKP